MNNTLLICIVIFLLANIGGIYFSFFDKSGTSSNAE